MPVRLKPLTRAQLVGFFKDYRDAFPEWSVERDVVLFRAVGPIKQVIAFEALRSGAYRPSHGVRVAGPPGGGQILFQFLDIRHREVSPREHAAQWPLVVQAMEEQFVPPIRRPLDLGEVLRHGGEEATGDGANSVTLSSLAALSAHLEEFDQSLAWCDRSSSRLAGMGRELADGESRLVRFNEQLREAIQSGRAGEFLRQGADRSSA